MRISRRVLLDAIAVVKAIEDAIAAFREDAFPPSVVPTLSDCEFPDHIPDPFELLRILHGNEYVSELEYIDDIEYIAEVIDSYIHNELRKRGHKRIAEFLDEESSEDEGGA
jgi:hypothetical protein